MNCSGIASLAPLYLSRELDEPQADEFLRHLEGCPSCAREMEQQAEFDARIRESLRSLADSTALENRVRGRIAADGRGRRHRWLAAAAALAMGVLGFRVLMDARVPRLCSDAAEDHRDEVVKRQHLTWIADPASVSTLARRVGIEKINPVALAPEGYVFEHARLCRLDGQVFVHLVYVENAREVSVFLRPHSGSARPKQIALDGEHIASIETDRLTAVAVTGEPGNAALRMAQSAARYL